MRPVGGYRRASVDDPVQQPDQLPLSEIAGIDLAVLGNQCCLLRLTAGTVRIEVAEEGGRCVGALPSLCLVLLVTKPGVAGIIPPLGAELAMDKLLDQIGDRAGAGPLLLGSLFRVLSLFPLLDGV